MSLSRKRRRELKKLAQLANTVFDEQKIVLDHAGTVLSEAGYQARKLSDEHFTPRVATAYAAVRPGLEGALARIKGFSLAARDSVRPYTSTAVLRAAAALEAADRSDLAKQLTALGAKAGLVEPPKRGKLGKIIAAVSAVTVAAAVGYSLFQAFRDDDQVWITPETD